MAISSRPTTRLLLAAVVLVAAVAGWRLFFFLTDDAFITFRYVSNSLAGRGIVWNPAPFKPVEGYTSFLWLVILRELWQLLGIEPPDSAGVVSLLFGLGTLFLTYRFVMRMSLPARLERWRPALVVIVLAGVLSNRTFLTWLSSGLETALFNFLVTWWVYEGTARDGRDSLAWSTRLSLSASLCALCRPDGLLLVLGTVAILGAARSVRLAVAGSIPLLLVVIHLLWRHGYYGDWLPNTYYAKHVAAWPESGLRYLACFVLEYGVWFWALLAIEWAIVGRRNTDPLRGRVTRAIPILVVVAHVAYYTLIIGGDHFEFRVYSELVPLLFVSGVWFASRIASRPGAVVAFSLVFVAVSEPIPWVHWWATRDVRNMESAHTLARPIAGYFPPPIRSVVAQWDRWEAWLIEHHVGMRQEEHKAYWLYNIASFPARAEGEKIPWEEHHVYEAGNVGVPGSVLPNVAIIDMFGLNDRVIAHTPSPRQSGEEREMAHDRRAPSGYLECFRPDVTPTKEGMAIVERHAPLTDDDIRHCEGRHWPSL